MTPVAPPRSRPPQPAASRRLKLGNTIEDQVRLAYYTPDPTTYSAPNTHSQALAEPKALGRISSSVHPSPLDHFAKTRAFVPGPGSYSTPELALPEGGRLNRNPPVQKEKLWDDYPMPGPGHVGVPNDPARPRLVSGAFSKERRVPKYIMEQVDRSKGIPGPGAHEVLEAMDSIDPFCPEGGRCMVQGKPASYFDAAPNRYQDNPDPGAYNLPSSLKTNTAQGKLVYRYESATMAETRDLVNRMSGAANEAPGPGTYDIPDPPPIAPTPSLKGRSLPFAMPHPFAYNCAPDTLGKYTNSVLSRSSADQIFGIGVRRGAGKGPKTPTAQGGDMVEEKALPVHVGPLAAEQPEAQVEWKAGGFVSLKKSRSVAPPPKPEHPSVKEAAKCYPMLQRRHRSASAFLPMASRRTESLPTHASSEEVERIRQGKWHLGALAQGISQATSAALEPLDIDKLKREAMRGLEDKAKERMRLEGVSKVQQQAILEEMRSVMHEQVKPVVPKQQDGPGDQLQQPEGQAAAPGASDRGSGGEPPAVPQLDPAAAAAAEAGRADLPSGAAPPHPPEVVAC